MYSMVYIYRKIIGKKPYYYLRASSRKAGKVVTKDIAYLGSTVADVQKALDDLAQFKQEIRKAHKTLHKFITKEYHLENIKQQKLKANQYIEKELFQQVHAAAQHFNQEFTQLDETTQEEVFTQFLIDFAFNTTSLEGNTITLKEAHLLLAQERLPKDRTLREVYDLQNTEKVFFWLLQEKPLITEHTIINIHDKLLERIDERKGYRTHDVRVFKSRFEVTPGKYVATDMTLLLEWYAKNNHLHPLVLATLFHHKFEKIHPFADGNGRTGRMLLNLILIKNNHPPIIIPKKRRKQYIQALQTADEADINSVNAKHYKELCEYTARELVESYWNNFNI